MPAMSAPRTSISPACSPARSSSPIEETDSRIDSAHSIALLGLVNVAMKPSPTVLTSVP